jgi:hypothetical protein
MIWNALFSVIAILPHTFLALGAPAPDREVTSRQTQNKYVFAHFMVSARPGDGDFISAVVDLRCYAYRLASWRIISSEIGKQI